MTDNVYKRLNKARQLFHASSIKKSGRNTFAKYEYFELGDFVIPAIGIFDTVGLASVTSFTDTVATMAVVNVDSPSECITFTSPMGSAALKGCHEVQNIGAVETYQRRYLWQTVLEIVEHDAIDATTGDDKNAPANKKDVNPALITDSQRDIIAGIAEAAGVTLQAICQSEKIDSLKKLPASRFSGVQRKLEITLQKKQKETA